MFDLRKQPRIIMSLVLLMFTFGAAFNPVKYYKAGGPVMHILLFLFVIVVAVTIERILVAFMRTRQLTPKGFADFMDKSLEKNKGNKDKAVSEMMEICDKKGGALSRILKDGLLKYQECKIAKLSMMESKQWMTQAVEDKGRVEIPILEQRLSIISTIAGIAPLIGLFGTVIGMVAAFETMASAAGGAKPDELSGDISVALLTTSGGLVVAIPSLIVFNYLKNKSEGDILRIEEVVLLMVDTLVDR